MSETAGVAEAGFYRRMVEDAPLVTLIGSTSRIVPGWPGDIWEDEAAFPRLTFYVSGPAPIAKGIQRLRVSADIWVWPTGPTGGRAKLLAIDARLMGLMDEQSFHHADHWIYGQSGGFRDFPAAPGAPIRRTREILLDAAAITVPA